MSDTTAWEPVIGIEVHVELATQSKMYCGCAVGFGDDPNTNVCPTCLALPGALPVTNGRAIEWITKIGLALNCEIAGWSVFHRKNYFYADLPKNYQISQFDLPVCHDGWLDIDVDGETVRIGIERAHQEEDTGKSLHLGDGGRIHAATETLLDFNRAGVPLVEVVSRPDIRSAVQARAYAQTLREVIAELDVSDAKLEEGSIRFDANISVRPGPDAPFGTKVEIKNMNSFRSLEKAVDFEIKRQIAELEAGGEIIQETRHWDEEAGVTSSMRTKEGSSDYRYFTEPDLVPLVVTPAWREEIRATLPELPHQRAARYVDLGVDRQTAGALSSADGMFRQLFEETVAAGAEPRSAGNWITGEVVAWMRREDVEEIAVEASAIAEMIGMIDANELSTSAAKEVLDGILRGEGGAREVAESRDLLQMTDTGAIESAVDAVLADNADDTATASRRWSDSSSAR